MSADPSSSEADPEAKFTKSGASDAKVAALTADAFAAAERLNVAGRIAGEYGGFSGWRGLTLRFFCQLHLKLFVAGSPRTH